MNIVVTGATGFLGSWVCRLLAQNHKVIGLFQPHSNTYRLSGIENLKLRPMPASEWAQFVQRSEPDALLLFDWAGVGNSERNSSLQIENLDRWAQLVKAANSVETGIVMAVGSQAEVGPHFDEINENADDNPTTAYGVAKVQARLALEKILIGSKSRFVWLRVFSTYGPMDSPQWLIPSVIDSLDIGKVVDLTPAEQEWSYLHAFDVATAVNATLSSSQISGVVNVGNKELVTIRDAVSFIGSRMNSLNLLNFGAVPYRQDQVMRLSPSCTKLESIGWEPQVRFEDGVTQTISWFTRSYVPPLPLIGGQLINLGLPQRP